jgi:hypothetical protein
VGDELGERSAAGDGHLEGVHHESALHVIGHRPADDPAAEQVLDHGQVQPSFPGRDVGDIDGLIANDKFCLTAATHLPPRRSNIR